MEIERGCTWRETSRLKSLSKCMQPPPVATTTATFASCSRTRKFQKLDIYRKEEKNHNRTRRLSNLNHLPPQSIPLCRKKMPGLTIGDAIPNLQADSTHGKIRLHDYIDGSWAIIFSHPGDFTPVCTTELAMMAAHADEFGRRGVKLIGLSCDDVQSHNEWTKDIEAYSKGKKVTYPILADSKGEIIKELNMVDPDEKDSAGRPLPSRALHIVGPDKKVKLSFLYPASTGRNIDEVMRALESLQSAAKHKVATPVNWKPGDKVIIPPNVTSEQAKQMFPQGFETVDLPSKKDYLRFAAV